MARPMLRSSACSKHHASSLGSDGCGARRSPDRAGEATVDWSEAQAGDVRLLTFALRCVGPLSHKRGMALGWEVIGIDANETPTVGDRAPASGQAADLFHPEGGP